MIRPVCAMLLCGLLAAQETNPPKQTAAPAQQAETAADQPQTVIRTSVTYVSTPVWVYDRDGDYVNGLQPDQFRLFDNGKEQQIRVDVSFTPISLVLCVQANSHVQGLLPQVRKIGALIKPLLTGDQGEVALIAYDSRVRKLQDFTSDADKITAALNGIYPGGDANHMIDAVSEATRMLRSRPQNRQRIILLIGETRDLYSEMHLREAMIDLQLANVVFYAVDMSRFITMLTAPAPTPRWDTRDATMMGNATLPSGVPATPTTVMQATGSQGGTAQFLPMMIELFRDAKAIFRTTRSRHSPRPPAGPSTDSTASARSKMPFNGSVSSCTAITRSATRRTTAPSSGSTRSKWKSPAARTSGVCKRGRDTGSASGKAAALLAFHSQIVLHREHTAHGVGAHPGQIFIRLGSHDADQRDMPVIHDDVDRRNGLQRVAVQARLAVNGAVDGDADLVIHRGERQHLDLVHHAGDALNPLHCGPGIGLYNRIRHLAHKRDHPSVHAVLEIIEDVVIGQHQQFMTHFAADAVL